MNGFSWNFTYMKHAKIEGEECRRLELYQMKEIKADGEDNIRKIIGIHHSICVIDV